MLKKSIDLGVSYCIRHSKLVIAAALLLAALSAIYTARHFAIDTDINNLIWTGFLGGRMKSHFRKPFRRRWNSFWSTSRRIRRGGQGCCEGRVAGAGQKVGSFSLCPGSLDSSFFRRNGLLSFLPIRSRMSPNSSATRPPLLSGLARDPSLRGLVQALVGILDYAKQGYVSFDDMARPLNLAAATLEGVAQGHPVEFSWRTLAGGDPRPLDLIVLLKCGPFSTKAHSNPVVGRRLPFAKSFRSLGFKKKVRRSNQSDRTRHHIRQQLPGVTKERHSMAPSRVPSF